MNPEIFLVDVEILLCNSRPAGPGRYTLRLDNKQPVLSKGDPAIKKDTVLAVLTSKDINEGITLRTWNKIRDRFAILQKRGQV